MQRRSSTSVRVFYPKLNRKELLHLLSERMEELKRVLPLLRVVLFGSYAKGNYTAGSDVDLLVVYNGELRDDAFATVKNVLGIPRLEPHLYTREEYEKMKTILNRMTEGGVMVFSGDEGR